MVDELDSVRRKPRITPEEAAEIAKQKFDAIQRAGTYEGRRKMWISFDYPSPHLGADGNLCECEIDEDHWNPEESAASEKPDAE